MRISKAPSPVDVRFQATDTPADWNEYRIGDGIAGWPGSPGCETFPRSIVCAYRRETDEYNDIPALIRVLRKFPTREPGKTVAFVHVRIGDGLCYQNDTTCRGNRQGVPDCWNDDLDCWYDPNSITKQYAYSKLWYETVVLSLQRLGYVKTIVVIGDKRHWTRTPDPRNGDFSNDEKYLKHIAGFFESNGFQVIVRDPGLPDEDFALLCFARVFVPGGGGYSSLISRVVTARGGLVIRPKKEEVNRVI